MSTISGKYAKSLIHREFIKELAVETFNDIYETQAKIANTFPNKSDVVEFLNRRPYSIKTSGQGITVVANFPTEVRRMDLKYWANQKKKTGYTPIYNKIIGGFIYGYLYKRLIYGISKQMNQAVTQRLQAAGYNIQ